MTIPVQFVTRYAIPLVVAAIFLGDVDVPEQVKMMEKTQRLADEVLSSARREGGDPPTIEVYDYIIVGGGSAGAILANRLTASGTDRVLLLEAGGDPNPYLDVPYGQRFFLETEMDWNYNVVQQTKACLGSNGYCPWHKGKALGGSSSVNGLVYNRGKPKDYDLWANFTGDSSWSWQNIMDTFNSFEDYHGFYEETAGSNHGYGGELYIGKIDYLPGVEIFEEVFTEKGIPLGDLNGGEEFTYGFSKIDYNIKQGLRQGSYQAFLEPILNRTNLIIYRYAYATKIDISLGDVEYRAEGVTYTRHGKMKSALAEKEVIICAGVVESPKLLMLSGVGPRDHLEELGIPTVIDLPVGKYMQDHPGMDVVGNSGGFALNTTIGGLVNTTEAVLEFIENGTGPLNALGDVPQLMMGYWNSTSNPDRTWPDLHLYVHELYKPPPADMEEQVFFSLELARPNSLGYIKLASSNPNDEPIIDPNFFEDSQDLERMVDGIEFMMDILLNSATFQRYGIQNVDVFEPCRGEEFQSRNYWKCVIQQRSIGYFHPTSTCRMGPNNSVAVLDSKLKVFGTQNLRVIDASSMPFVPSGNTNLPAMLIGARGAEIILAEQ